MTSCQVYSIILVTLHNNDAMLIKLNTVLCRDRKYVYEEIINGKNEGKTALYLAMEQRRFSRVQALLKFEASM